MRVLVGTGLCLFLAQVLVLALHGQQAAARSVDWKLQGGAEHEHEFTFLDEHLSSVLHHLLHADGGGDGLRDIRVGAKELPGLINSLEEIVSLVTVRTSLGLAHVHELDEPATAALVAALSRRVPAKQQEALKHLRIIMAAVHGLLCGASAPGHGGAGGIKATAADGRASGGGGGAMPVPELSFPLLRRAIVARLTQLWLLYLRGRGSGESGSGSGSRSGSRLAPWAAAARRELGRTLLMLFRLHRGGMQSRGVLEFLHISKAAGTSMCRLAEVSGCHAQDFSMGRTCLMRDFDDQPRWINGSHHWKLIASTAEPWGAHPYAFLLYGVPRGLQRKRTCPSRMALLEKHKLDFFANEYTIYNNLTEYNKNEPEEEKEDDDDADAGAGQARVAPPSPPSPPKPRAPPLPPLSVVFEETAERYAQYVAQLLAAEEGGPAAAANAAGGGVGGNGGGGGGASLIMGGAHLCRSFANVAVLRDPVERFISHLTFIAQTYGTMYKWPGIAQAFAPGRTSAAWWRSFSPPLFDNYMLRTLGGEAVFAMSYDSLEAGAAAYMALARAMLAQYDVILVLEVGESGHRRACQFGLGWRHLLTEFQLRNASSLLKKLDEMVVYGADLQLLLPEGVLLEELKQFAVRYDSQLYRYGALLAGLDDVVWRVAAEALGEPLQGFRGGEGPKCGYVHSMERPPPAPPPN